MRRPARAKAAIEHEHTPPRVYRRERHPTAAPPAATRPPPAPATAAAPARAAAADLGAADRGAPGRGGRPPNRKRPSIAMAECGPDGGANGHQGADPRGREDSVLVRPPHARMVWC